MRGKWLWRLLVCWLIAPRVCADSPSVAGSGIQPDAEKLFLREAGADWGKVKRWSIEYEATPTAGIVRLVPGHKIVAVASPGDFYQLSAHFPAYPWRWDPYSQEIFIHNGRTCHRWPFNRSYTEGALKPDEILPGTVPDEILLTVIPSWPLVSYRMPDNESGMRGLLTEALSSPDYKLLPESQMVDGEKCSVLSYKGGIDLIWVAQNKGLCVMRREIQDLRSRRLFHRIVTDKVGEVAPGLWLPTEFRSQRFVSNGNTNEQAIEWESTIRILSYKMNEEVSDSIFVPTHSPGSIQYEADGKFTQISPGGEDLLDEMVNFMTTYGNLPTKPQRTSCLWLIVGLGAGLSVAFLVLPMRN